MDKQSMLLILDGNSLTHRSYYALGPSPRNPNPLTTSEGKPIWAVHGFFSTLASLCEMVDADGLVVGFDNTRTVNYRKASFPEYKATREKKGDDLYLQMDHIEAILRELGVCVVKPEGWEADDVVASASVKATEAGWQSTIATGDRDSFACITDTCTVLRLLPGGLNKAVSMTPQVLADSYGGISPAQYVDFAALRGDKSDNLDGVKGVGEKAAAKILDQFGSVQKALDAGEDAMVRVLGKSTTAKLLAGVENWKRNVEMMAGHTDLDINIDKTRLAKDQEEVKKILVENQLFNLSGKVARYLSKHSTFSEPAFTPSEVVAHQKVAIDLSEDLW